LSRQSGRISWVGDMAKNLQEEKTTGKKKRYIYPLLILVIAVSMLVIYLITSKTPLSFTASNEVASPDGKYVVKISHVPRLNPFDGNLTCTRYTITTIDGEIIGEGSLTHENDGTDWQSHGEAKWEADSSQVVFRCRGQQGGMIDVEVSTYSALIQNK